MFETVVPETVRPKSRKVFYETLPVSLAIHGLVVAATLLGATWNIEFPAQSPKMFMAYSLVEPPPPPPPPPPPVPKRAPVPTLKPVPVKMPLVAPTVIPDFIPEVLPVEAPEPVAPVASEVDESQGAAGGVEGGEIDGMVGGVIGAIPTLKPVLPDTVVFERDTPLPMPAVAQEYPPYPEHAWIRGWQDVLVVRYIIDKKGRVREVTVIKPPEREDFTRVTLDKIRHWRFQPYKDESGKLKEVVHELTVEFKIVRRASKR